MVLVQARPQDVTDVASLRARENTPTDFDKIYLKSNTDFYDWDASSTAVDDGVNVIKQTNITTGRWVRVVDDTKQNALTLTTTGTGAATLVGNTLNIPTPSGGGAATVNYVRRTIATPSLATLTPLGLANAVSAGTVAAVGLAATSNYTKIPKVAYRVTTAATTAVARYQSVSVYMCGTRDITVRILAGIDTGGNNASKQFFIGLGNATAPNASTTSNPITGASYPNTIGMGLDIASTQFAVFARNATVTTQTSTGIADPTADGTIFFEVVISLKADRTATVNWKELVSGVSGTATYTAAETPVLNTTLSPGAWITSGGVSSVIGLGFGCIEGTE